jgi:alginate O-acetyltransferase complex protein AlgI
MFGTTFIDWLMSLVIAHNTWQVWRVWNQPVKIVDAEHRKTRIRRTAITISIVCNLVVLGFSSTSTSASILTTRWCKGLGLEGTQLNTFFRVVLPLGISFYTFQALSYTIDVYRGNAEAMANFIDFSCFVSMFPHLVAGPILKFSFLADQLKNRRLTSDKFARGVAFFMMGVAKKFCWRIRAVKSRTRHLTPARFKRSTRGSDRSRIRSRFISISAATPTWRSGSA